MELQGRNLSSGLRGDDVALLQEELGQLNLGVSIPEVEIQRRLFGEGTRAAVIAFQRKFSIEATGVVDERTAIRINAEVDAATPRGYVVQGRVVSRGRAGVGGLKVEIVDKGVGGDQRLARATTDDGGGYRATFSSKALQERGKLQPDLQARAFAGERTIGASEVRYDASTDETLDILVEADAETALASEYETLTASLAAHVRGSLRELEESEERQDITYLANKTGWDARAVALATLAGQFSERSRDAAGGRAIEPELFYALFRAGLPANESAIYQTDPNTADEIWRRSIEQGVVPASLADVIPQAAKRFARLAARRMLDAPALAGKSSMKEMLSMSFGDDAGTQQRFAELYTRHRDEPEQLWEAVREAFGERAERRLRIDGQLGYLTLNNAPLIRRLHEAAGSDGLGKTASLVDGGYYRAASWRELIGDEDVPREVPGDDDEERRGRYAELMAAQMRLSFPTAVVADQVKRGETPVKAELRDQVHAFLSEQRGSFEIGRQPVEQFIARNDLQPPREVIREIKRIQRVYQITAGDDAMNTLLKRDVDSAYAVVRYDQDEFVQAFKGELGERSALLTYAKATQVHNAALNIATSYLISGTIPAIGVHSPALVLDPSPKGPDLQAANAGDVIAYPTLEGLFGEMDFCACEHCRSILSPAAYLVDLLLFCDRPTNEKEDPQDVLFERRPDIQHLPLTCENTNTPLPYIDLVNETLEYYITNNLSLAAYTGHSTDASATPEELLASPRFVSDAAYATLATEHFPPPMPFHRPLENMRRYFDRFEAPLPEVMEVLRTDDSLERSSPADYGWRDILMEELRLSRAEYAILSDRGITLQQLYGFAPATPEAQVLAEIQNVKTFTRRVGISYEDIFDILRTRFINPSATLLPKLDGLGVPFSTLKALKDGAISDAQFDALLPPGLDTSNYGGDVTAWVKDEANYARIMGLITVANPGDEEDLCSFDKVEFRYADPDANANALRSFDFVCLIRFIRLWKKLGWTVRQTDAAITALYPPELAPIDPSDAVKLEQLDNGFLTLLPRLGMVMRAIAALRLKPKRDLLSLLACFAPVDTDGPTSLYRQMFLSSSLDEQDEAFADDGFGGYLGDANEMLTAHAETLRAAFRLTDGELNEISAALGFDDNTPLDLENISAIFRRGWLARKLRLSVRELLLLTRFTEIDPFAAPDPPVADLLEICTLVKRFRAASLKPVEALYLIWNQDLSGRSAPEGAEVRDFARSLRSGLAAVESEFALAEDPDGEIARARMALVYGATATDLFFGLLGNTLLTEVGYSHAQAALEQPVLDAAPGRIAYDDLRKRLSFTGVLDTTTRDAIKAAAAAELATAVDELYQENQKIVGPYFARYPELRPLFDAYAASSDPAEQKRSELLAAFLPELVRRRKRQQALQAVAAVAKVDLSTARSVLDDAVVLHRADDDTRPAVDDLTAMESGGLSAQFFDSDTATGTAAGSSDREADLDYSAGGPNPLPVNGNDPNATISGIWSGHLAAPEDGFYNLRFEADPGSTVSLDLDGATVGLAQNGAVWSNAEPIELRAGTLHPVTLRVDKVMDRLGVEWQTSGSGWQPIAPRHLYSATLGESLGGVYVRFLKTVSLASELKMSPAEMVHFATDADYDIVGRGWLNVLPVTGDPDPATSTALLEVLSALLDFARIKAELSPDDERLLRVLQDPVAATGDSDALLPALTRWETGSLDALLTRFGMTVDDLGRLADFRRVEAGFGILKRLRVSGTALIEASTNEPDGDTVRAFRAALRARYDESDWLDVLQPINDQLRELRRDALVAHVLHRMGSAPSTAHIDTPDKLFEYFLMDVQMAACTQTSRIRHALSSVQLFVERCLMNLEPRVAPSSIKAAQWEWMRRYRVWEANRKVFLYPENWLEPELRDDQSPFFKETMSELLQSDITEDKAAAALASYLSKLDQVAKLEPCAIHCVENDPGTTDDVAHVVARTPGGKSTYYYRRREYGYWTPMEQIKLDIDDNPVLPVVWKGRLFLFWLKILKRMLLDPPIIPGGDLGEADASAMIPSGPARVEVEAILCWSEHFNGEWLPPRTSDITSPAFVTRLAVDAFRRSKLRLSAVEDGDALEILITDDDPGATRYYMYNTHSLPQWDLKVNYVHELPRVLDTGGSTFTVEYADPDQPDGFLSREVIKSWVADRTVQPRHHLQAPREAPFFYEDGRHVFYVSTSLRQVKFPHWQLYAVASAAQQPAIEIPPMVFEKVKFEPDILGPVLTARNAGAVDPGPMERFVSEDAYINKGIGTTGTVSFGDRQIGPSGSFVKRVLEP